MWQSVLKELKLPCQLNTVLLSETARASKKRELWQRRVTLEVLIRLQDFRYSTSLETTTSISTNTSTNLRHGILFLKFQEHTHTVQELHDTMLLFVSLESMELMLTLRLSMELSQWFQHMLLEMWLMNLLLLRKREPENLLSAPAFWSLGQTVNSPLVINKALMSLLRAHRAQFITMAAFRIEMTDATTSVNAWEIRWYLLLFLLKYSLSGPSLIWVDTNIFMFSKISTISSRAKENNAHSNCVVVEVFVYPMISAPSNLWRTQTSFMVYTN